MNSNCIYICCYCFFYQPHILTNLFILKWHLFFIEIYHALIREFPEYR